MPTATYIPLATITLSSSASSVTFGSIPNTYKDLILVVNGATNGDTNQGGLRFNSDSSTSNYTTVQMAGYSTTTLSNVRSSDGYVNFTPAFSFSTSQAVAVIQIMDYSATDKHKTVLSRMNQAQYAVQAMASRWASTNAITSIQVFLPGGSNTYNSGSTFSLYGIAG